jgi:hypothetical protein
MSKLNDVLTEAKDKLSGLDTAPINLLGKIVIAYNESDMLDLLAGVRSYPAVGIIYEGMRSQPEAGSTAKVGVSCEIVVSFVLVEQGDAVVSTDQKKTRAIDYLDAMRGQFMGLRSTVTQHFWHFLVESPAELKAGMVVWVQRWSLPVQLPAK